MRCLHAVLGLATGVLTASGCNADAPTPTPIEEGQPAVMRPRRDPDMPEIRKDSPQVLAPDEREGEQLKPDALEAILAEAERYAAENRESVATVRLRDCANKIPASARCDGRLGVLLAKTGRHSAEATYYLLEAAETDDPKATAEDYDAVADALRKYGEYAASVEARKLAIAREDAAFRHAELSAALQGLPDQREAAMAELGRAYAMDPSQPKWLHDQATLMARDPARRDEAAALFEKFLAATKGKIPSRDTRIEQRIAELKAAPAPTPAPQPAPAPAIGETDGSEARGG